MRTPTYDPAPTADGTENRFLKPAGKLRWVICGMLLLATVINYLDRYALSVLAPRLGVQFHWTKQQFGWVLFAFQGTYAVMNLPWGAIMDRFGLRKGFSAAVVLWSAASMGHAFALGLGQFCLRIYGLILPVPMGVGAGVVGFGFWRAMLGIGEAANFPGAVKTIAEWFPQKERATAAGLLNAGANVGTMIAPAILLLLVRKFGWQAAFVTTGALGLLWGLGWWALYREPSRHPAVSQAERDWILQDGEHSETLPSIPWKRLIGERRAWAFILGKSFSDPVWGFFLFWLPTFLADVHHVSETNRMWILTGVYLMADVGSIGGGWLSSRLIQLGWPVNRSRKSVMALPALLVPFVAIVAFRSELWVAVMLIGLAVSMHQWWSSNLFTTASDMFPTQAIGTVVGMGQVGGGTLGMVVQPLVGLCYDHFHNYKVVFLVCAVAYPLSWLCLHSLAPKLDKVDIRTAEA